MPSSSYRVVRPAKGFWMWGMESGMRRSAAGRGEREAPCGLGGRRWGPRCVASAGVAAAGRGRRGSGLPAGIVTEWSG